METPITTIIDATELVAHGRPCDVLAKIEHFLRWQDHAIAVTAIEVDGEWYLPAWIFDA